MAKKRFTREYLIETLQKLYERLGRPLIQSDTHDYTDVPGHVTYIRYFGSWRAALAEVGLKPHRSKKYVYEREELLDMLRALANELGHTPTTPELMERDDLPHPTTFVQRLGGWNKGLEEAGLTPRYPGKGRDT